MDVEGVKNCWDELAKTKPVATMFPAGMSAIRDVDALFAFGQREIDDVMPYIESRGMNIGWQKALDFGRGLGDRRRHLPVIVMKFIALILSLRL